MKSRIITTLYAMLGSFLGGLLAVIFIYTLFAIDTYRYIPICQEDSVLIGTIDFDRGRWKSYICGPAVDDYAQGE